MKNTLPLVLTALLLLGCNEAQGPKLPPKVPEPKAAAGHPAYAPSFDNIRLSHFMASAQFA